MSAYPPSERTRIKRLHQRAAYDRATVEAVLDAQPLAHVGYVRDGAPVVIPTLVWRDPARVDRLYWHGSAASAMLRAVAGGVPVCVTASLLDGYVLARSGFHHSANYRSAVLYGRAAPLTDPAEKEAALEVMMERLFPRRWDMLRPMTPKETKATTVVVMTIEEAVAKIRTGGPVDDEEDYALPIWAGTIPTRLVADAPAADPRNLSGVVAPDHVGAFDPAAPYGCTRIA